MNYQQMAPMGQRRAPKLILLLLLGGLALMLLPSFWSVPFKGLFQLAGLCLFTAALFLVTRYMTKGFLYGVFDNEAGGLDFSVTELQGKRRCTVCLISLADIESVVTVDARKPAEVANLKARLKQERPKYFDYCSDLNPTLSCYLFVRENGGDPVAIRIMPDDTLLALLSKDASTFLS